MSKPLVEVNVDALPGPTHLFGGLGVGNLASIGHDQQTSSPRQAALQGLDKAALVAGLGVGQYLWLPPVRPNLGLLEQIGFSGPLREQLAAAQQYAPTALAAAFSSAFMWAANSGTFSPAVDCADGLNHFTPANLISSWHRGSEAVDRAADLRMLFDDVSSTGQLSQDIDDLCAHEPLPAIVPLRDEGAANHMRLSDPSGRRAINIFVYGDGNGSEQSRFFPRHTRAASEAVVQLHQLDRRRTSFVQQDAAAISAGAFHNDVIATGHQDVLLYHERAFVDGEKFVDGLAKQFSDQCGCPLRSDMISEQEMSLASAVESYFFNSQLVCPVGSRDAPSMALVCPEQCQTNPQARSVVQRLIDTPSCPVQDVHFVSLGQSMAGGGGPACVRLRLQLEPDRAEHFGRLFRWTEALDASLREAIEATYPDKLSTRELLDPDTVEMAHRAVLGLRKVVQGDTLR